MTSHESEAVEGQFLLRAGASGSALEAWHGRDENLAVGQRAFYHRACLNGAACVGKYTDEMEGHRQALMIRRTAATTDTRDHCAASAHGHSMSQDQRRQ